MKIKLSLREGYILVCESGTKIGDNKLTKLEVKENKLIHTAVYLHMKPIVDVCLDVLQDLAYVLDGDRGKDH